MHFIISLFEMKKGRRKCSVNVFYLKQVCPGGFVPSHDSAQCVSCPAGKYAYNGSMVCKDCSKGTYSLESSVVCSSCPQGFRSVEKKNNLNELTKAFFVYCACALAHYAFSPCRIRMSIT